MNKSMLQEDLLIGNDFVSAVSEKRRKLANPATGKVWASIADGDAEDDGNGTTKFRWESDSSQTAASAILVYSPNGRPVLRNGAASEQLGYFRSDDNVETSSSPFANSVETLAEMVVLNYLGLHGEQAMFGQVLDNPNLGTGAAVDPYIAFDPIV